VSVWNRMSVSRALRLFGEPGRPVDWFSQKSCALQYGNLLENVDTPKRKKRTDKSGSEHVETPGEAIVRNLTHGRNH
jgi:bromodomain-containing protein 8